MAKKTPKSTTPTQPRPRPNPPTHLSATAPPGFALPEKQVPLLSWIARLFGSKS